MTAALHKTCISDGAQEKLRPDVVCVGQAVVDCITRDIHEDESGLGKTTAGSITLSTGGDAVNESFALAALGVRTGLVCAAGCDHAGQILVGEAARRGVITEGITMDPGITTPVANIFVNKDGSRSSISSSASLVPGYVPDPKAFEGAKIVSFASLFRAPLDRPEVIGKLIRAAHAGGAVVCADTKLPTYRRVSLDDISEVLPFVDYMFPNAEEAAYYSGCRNFDDMADAFLKRGVRHLIIKTGAEGCRAYSWKESYVLPAKAVDVVDSTGAGDNFAAGFMAAVLYGADLREACEAGLMQAAECIARVGAV